MNRLRNKNKFTDPFLTIEPMEPELYLQNITVKTYWSLYELFKLKLYMPYNKWEDAMGDRWLYDVPNWMKHRHCKLLQCMEQSYPQLKSKYHGQECSKKSSQILIIILQPVQRQQEHVSDGQVQQGRYTHWFRYLIMFALFQTNRK